jgi:GntR family transcriptional regulator
MAPVLPVYYQIKETIKNQIINREFKSGAKIPSENELAGRFGVNRLTVRQATSQLVQEGFLISKRGEGTFVTGDQDFINSLTFESTGFMDAYFYQISKSRLVTAGSTRISLPELILEKLEQKRGNSEAIQIKRVQYLEGKPYAYHINYFPIEIGTRVLEADLDKRVILQIIEQDLGIRFTEAFQTIQASFADQEVSEQLRIPSGSPVLTVESTMYTKRRSPVYLVQSSYRGDLYRYIVRLKKLKGKNQDIWHLVRN